MSFFFTELLLSNICFVSFHVTEMEDTGLPRHRKVDKVTVNNSLL